MAVYGHYGFALLMLPTATADYLEYERYGLIAAIAPAINSGKCKVFSINSVNHESWMNYSLDGRQKILGGQTTPDEVLMRRFQRGDARAFPELVRRHRAAVFAFVLRWTQDRAREWWSTRQPAPS